MIKKIFLIAVLASLFGACEQTSQPAPPSSTSVKVTPNPGITDTVLPQGKGAEPLSYTTLFTSTEASVYRGTSVHLHFVTNDPSIVGKVLISQPSGQMITNSVRSNLAYSWSELATIRGNPYSFKAWGQNWSRFVNVVVK
jgi:hypothetical protein